MKKYSNNIVKAILSALMFSVIAFTTKAQKLPNVQKVSVRAPVNIKIDGKATEWNNRFQAYNHATDIYYTLSNDDNKLYLTVQATNPSAINKIIMCGITLTVNSSGDRKDRGGVAITFPARETKIGETKGGLVIKIMNKPKESKDTAMYRMQTDSFMNASNKKLTDSLKVIGITGLKQVDDNNISIYNDMGIKAAALFDHKINYIYELAVPLKYLGLSINNKSNFSYQVKINGALPSNAIVQPTSSGRFIAFTVGNNETMVIPNTGAYLGMAYPTDFWGEYTLEKK